MKSSDVFSALRAALKTFNSREKRKLLGLMIAQSLSSLLDLLGVALVGIIGAVSISGVASQQPGSRVFKVISSLGISGQSMQYQVIVLAIATVLLLLLKTITGIVLTKQSLKLMSNKSAEVTTALFSKTLSLKLIEIQERSSQQTLYALTNSLVALIVGVLGTTITIISDAFLSILLISALFLVDPLTATISCLLFGTIGIVTFIRLGRISQELGLQTSKLEVSSSELVLQALDAYRETLVGNRQKYYEDSLWNLRKANAHIIATAGFLPHISKYVIEAGMVLGAFVLSALQFYLHDAFHAVATLTIFLAAGSRIAPAILRLQQSGIQIRNSLGVSRSALDLLSIVDKSLNHTEIKSERTTFSPHIKLSKVDFLYPDAKELALNNISLEIQEGEFVAIVGPSGGGKSTLVDTILGVHHPLSGEVQLSGVAPLVSHMTWPGKTAYVPQQITIFDVSLAENVALGLPFAEIDLKRVDECLIQAQLSDLTSRNNGDQCLVLGEKGNRLSGGQRQRIGIARALYSNPNFIIFDEATSALDVETEKSISDAIKALKGKTTILVIAHRLSTIKDADIIHYVDSGKIVASGSLPELRRKIPAFERQAALSGI